MTSRKNEEDNSSPERQKNNVENDPPVDAPPMEERHVPISDAENISMPQLEPVDQSRPLNIPRTLKAAKLPAISVLKPNPVTRAAKSVPNPTTTIHTLSTTTSRSILKPIPQTAAARSVLKSTKTTRTARTVLEPATITIVARPEPTRSLGIPRTTCTVTSGSRTSTTTSCVLPRLQYTSSVAKNTSTTGTKITEVTWPSKIPRRAILTPEPSTTVTSTSYFRATTCTTTSTTVSLSNTVTRTRETTDRPVTLPRIYSLAAPSRRHGAKTYVAEAINKPLPTSSESSPVRLVLRPTRNVPSTGTMQSPPSINFGSTPLAETVSTATVNVDLTTPRQDPAVQYESRTHVVTSRRQDTPRVIRRPQPDLTQAPILLSHRFPIRQDPAFRLIPITTASRSSATQVPPSRQPSAACSNIRIIQEYWIRRNTEMLTQVGGSVNDSISSRLPLNYAAAFRAPVHEIATPFTPMNVASTSRAAPRVIVLGQNIRLNLSRKKKNLKGIKRKQANPVELESTSSSEDSMSLPEGLGMLQMRVVHRRPKRRRKSNTTNPSSGYPNWKDENTSQVSPENGDELKPVDAGNNDESNMSDMSAKEKVELFLRDVQRYGGLQRDDDDDSDMN